MSTDLNVRPYNKKELFLFPASMGDYLPKDHLAHAVDENWSTTAFRQG